MKIKGQKFDTTTGTLQNKNYLKLTKDNCSCHSKQQEFIYLYFVIKEIQICNDETMLPRDEHHNSPHTVQR